MHHEMKTKYIIYWGIYIAISLVSLYFGLQNGLDSISLLVILLAWTICFWLYEVIRMENAYQNNKGSSLKVVRVTWLNVLGYLGLIILFIFNQKSMGFSTSIIVLGIAVIAIGFYLRTVHMYIVTQQGILYLNKDRLIRKEAIKQIYLQENILRIETLDADDTLVLPIKKDVEEKSALFKKLIEKN